MNVVLSVTGSMITDRRLINGRMNIQTPDSLSQIDFCVNILDFVNVYLYDLSEDLTETFDTLRPDFVEVINAYATMFCVNYFFPDGDEADSYEIEYEKQLKDLMNQLVQL